MAVVINTNSLASFAAANVLKSNDLLQKSLSRLSSGSRISTASDDAGGLAVSMKLASSIKRSDAEVVNLANALSFLQTQAGSIKTASTVLERMSELAVLSEDVSKAPQDIANYSTEFHNLFSELRKISSDSFNGIDLFKDSGSTLKVHLSEDGMQSMTIDQGSLSAVYSAVSSIDAVSGGNLPILDQSIQRLATMMAANGAQASRLQFAIDSLNISRMNLDAAKSRIFDVDVASETTKLARANVLVQSGASMLSQANSAAGIALKLLQ
jgi:flagellin